MSGTGSTSKASGILRGWMPSLIHSWNIKNCIHIITAMWNDFKQSHHINHQFFFTKKHVTRVYSWWNRIFSPRFVKISQSHQEFFRWHLKFDGLYVCTCEKNGLSLEWFGGLYTASGPVYYYLWCQIWPFYHIGAKKEDKSEKVKYAPG